MQVKLKNYLLFIIGILLIPTVSFATTTVRIDMDANTPGLQNEIRVSPGEYFTTNIEIVLDGITDSLSSFGYSLEWDAGGLDTPLNGDVSTSPLAGGWTDLGYSLIQPSYISNFAQITFAYTQGPLTTVVATINWKASSSASVN